jgi:Flp pilus assembly pilin Flp
MNHISHHLSDQTQRSEDGQTMAEYSVVIAVIALVVVFTLPQLGSGILALYSAAAAAFGA